MISVDNLSNVGENAIESVILNCVVYLDVEIKSLVSKPINYTYIGLLMRNLKQRKYFDFDWDRVWYKSI